MINSSVPLNTDNYTTLPDNSFEDFTHKVESEDSSANSLLISESTANLDSHIKFLKGKSNSSDYFLELNSTIERVDFSY